MGKKLGINQKSAVAKDRKAEVLKAEKSKKEKEKEDAAWNDDDKKLAKKLEKKESEEQKKAELLRKKAENKMLLEQETKLIQSQVAPKVSNQKVTRSQIVEETEKRRKTIENINNPSKPIEHKVAPLEANLNRAMFDTLVARNVDEALAVLSVDTEDDRHPEKRLKAAFKAYEEQQLSIIKAENPSLKLSQLKQLIFKNWQKSPENPLNKT